MTVAAEDAPAVRWFRLDAFAVGFHDGETTWSLAQDGHVRTFERQTSRDRKALPVLRRDVPGRVRRLLTRQARAVVDDIGHIEVPGSLADWETTIARRGRPREPTSKREPKARGDRDREWGPARQGNSAVEGRSHEPAVGGSSPPPATPSARRKPSLFCAHCQELRDGADDAACRRCLAVLTAFRLTEVAPETALKRYLATVDVRGWVAAARPGE